MRTPALALLWETWARQRRVLQAAGLYLLGLLVLGRFVPADTLRNDALLLLAPLAGAFPILLASWAYGFDTPMESPRSGLPGRLFALPVSTAALVGWPMLFGGLTPALAWVLLGVGLLRPRGVAVPLLWPALNFAALVAWTQAVAWSPWVLPGLRLLVGAPLLGALVVGPVMLVAAGETPQANEPLVVALLAVLLAAAYPVTVAGVSRARRGDPAERAWPAWLRWEGRLRWDMTLSSPQKAQFWIEWRRCGLGFLLFPVLCLLFLLPNVYWAEWAFRKVDPTSLYGLWPALAGLVRTFGASWVSLAYLLFVPVMVGLCGIDLGRVNVAGHRYEMSSFLAARPLTTADFLRAKLRLTAVGMLIVWGSVLGIALLWAVLTGRWPDMAERLTDLGGARAWLALGLSLLALALLSWAHLFDGLWLTLFGRVWVVYGFIIGLMTSVTGLAGLGAEVSRHPEWHAPLARCLPWLLGALIAAKVLAGGALARRVVRRGLLRASTVGGIAGVWAAGVMALFALLAWLFPPEWVSRLILAEAAVLAVPLVGVLLNPLALDANRHR
jgi:hypothetical protein